MTQDKFEAGWVGWGGGSMHSFLIPFDEAVFWSFSMTQ